MGKWKKPRTRCPQCGLMCRPDSRLHARATFHRHYAKIVAALRNESTTFASVARQYRLSRERVRQLAAQLGFPPGRRREKMALENYLEAAFARILPEKKALESLGLKFTPVVRKNGRLSTLRVVVNGRMCALRGTRVYPWHVEQLGEGYVTLGQYHAGAEEFVLYRMPASQNRHDWLVIPAEAAPRSRITALFGRGPKDHPLARRDYKGKWLKYINAWHLLGAEKPAASGPPSA